MWRRIERAARGWWRRRKYDGRPTLAWYIRTPSFIPYMTPLYRGLHEEGVDARHILGVDFPMDEHLAPFRPRPDEVTSARSLAYDPTVDLFVVGQFQGKAHPNAVVVNVGHGFYTKYNAWSDEQLRNTDVVFARGPFEREMLETTFARRKEAASHIRIENVGHWKYDDLFQGRFERTRVLSELGLDPSRPTVLYAPAWDPGASLRKYGERVARVLLTLPDANVIVKLHSASLEPVGSPYHNFLTGGVDWRARFGPLAEEPRFRFVEPVTINPYLAAADCLVSDVSGVSMVFLALDKPVVVIDCPEYYEETLRVWGQDPEETLASPVLSAGRSLCRVVEGLDALPEAVAHAFAHPEEGSSARRRFGERLFYNRGCATEAAVKALRDLVPV